MNLRNTINKLLDWEWRRKEGGLSDLETSTMISIREDVDIIKKGFEKLHSANILVKQQIGQRAKTGDDAAEEFQGYIDSLGKEVEDLENELKTLRLRTTAMESDSQSRNNEMAGLRQQISLIKDRGAPVPHRDNVAPKKVPKKKSPIPKKAEKLAPSPPKLSVIDVVCEGASRAIKNENGAVKPHHIYTIVQTIGDYNEASVRSQISGILKSISWNNKEFYFYTRQKGLLPRKHNAPTLQLNAKQIRNGWTKYQRSLRQKK